MTTRTSCQLAVAVTAVAAVLAPCKPAFASGFSIARFGGEYGTVIATNPTAIYYNPGALGFQGTQLYLDGQLALRSLQWTHAPGQGDSAEPVGFAGANYGTATAFNVFGGPMLGATLKLGDVVLGAGAYAPFGGQVHFNRNETFANTMYPGAADGVARWHSYEAKTQSIYGTVGAAVRFGPLSLGATGNVIFTTLMLNGAKVLAGSGLNDLAVEGRTYLDVSSVNASFGVGAMVEAVHDQLWFGASYQAQPALGPMAMNGTLKLDASAASADTVATQNVTFHQALPDVIRLGVRYRPSPKVELRLAGDFTRWSVLQTQCLAVRDKPCTVLPDGGSAPGSGVIVNLRRYWDNTFGVRGGGSYWFSPEFEAFLGTGFETAANPDSTIEPTVADANNIAGAIGARWEVARTWFLQLGYTHLQFLPRNNTGLSTLADPATQIITRRPDGGGEYQQWVGVIDANVAKTF